MAAAASWSTPRFESPCRRSTSRSFSNERERSTPKPDPGSSRTTAQPSSPRTSRPSSESQEGVTCATESNGKIERFHRTAKTEVIRRFSPSTQAEAKVRLDAFLEHYNQKRLHSAIGYVTPADRLAGRQQVIWDERDRRLELAREKRSQRRRLAQAAESVSQTPTLSRSR